MNEYISELFTPTSELGSLRTYKIKKIATLKDVLKELKMEGKYFIAIVDGKKVNSDYQLKENEELIILPKIAGGIEKII